MLGTVHLVERTRAHQPSLLHEHEFALLMEKMALDVRPDCTGRVSVILACGGPGAVLTPFERRTTKIATVTFL